MPYSQKVSKIGYSSCFIFNTQNVLEPQKLIDRLFYIELLLSFHTNYLQIRGDQLPVTKRSMEPVQFTCEFFLSLKATLLGSENQKERSVHQYIIHSVCALQFTLFKWQSIVDTQHFHFGAEVLSFAGTKLKHSILFLFLIDVLLLSFLM